MDTTTLHNQLNETIELGNSEMQGKYLSFWTDNQLFAIPIKHVVQIVGMQETTEVPEFPFYSKGIINLRGAIIPLIDIRLRLGKPEAPYNERTCIIVTDINGKSIGLIVDEVDAVQELAEDSISPPPKIDNSSDNGYITGVAKQEKGVILLINPLKIVGDEEIFTVNN